MKKIALAAAFAGVASTAVAGGMAPVVVMEPVVVEEAAAPSSSNGLIIPLIALALIAVASQN